MSSYPQPPILPPWGELAQDSGDMVQPSNTQIEAGWPESATPPARQYFNWLFYFLSNAIRYLSQRGLTDFNSGEIYQLNARVIGDDGNTYVSLQNANTNNTPSTSPTWWKQWGFTGLNFSAASVVSFGANTQLTAAQMGGYGQVNAGGLTITLPPLSSVQLGATFTFAQSGNAYTVAGHGSDKINNGGSLLATLAGAAYECMTFVSGGGEWFISSDGVGGAQIASLIAAALAAGYAASFAMPGYIKFPTALGGFILQWSQGSPSAGTINVAFPIAFPNAALAVLGTTQTGTQTFSVSISGSNWSLTGNGTYTLFAIGH